MTKEIHYKIAKRLATILDDRFELFGIKFGLDPILDLFPVLGGILPAIFGLYIVWVADKLNLPQNIIRRLVFNVVVDFVIGLVPVLGNIGSVFYRSNRRNIQIIEDFRRNDGRDIEEGVIVG